VLLLLVVASDEQSYHLAYVGALQERPAESIALFWHVHSTQMKSSWRPVDDVRGQSGTIVACSLFARRTLILGT
jgi:hypothetical protein